jgi:uncharacterized delta-60 repeat protein
MWFLSARKTRRTTIPRAVRNTIRLVVEALEDRCVPTAGALDATFGNGGLVTGPIQAAGGYLVPVVVQPADGKIVSACYVIDAKSGYEDFALARYNPNGTLDTSFGNGGIVSTVVGNGNSYINGLALTSTGAIVAVGQGISKGNAAFAVARYTPSGSLDTSFGSGGIVLTIPAKGAVNEALAVGINPNTGSSSDKIYVAGYAGSNFTLVRYNANGSLDTSFGSSGIDITPNFGNGRDVPNALGIQSADGKIVLAGYNNMNGTSNVMAVARYLSSGALDSSFGTGGIVTLASPTGSNLNNAFGLFVQNGTIVVSGYSGQEMALARLTNAGQLDPTFGGSGTGFALNSHMILSAGITQGPNGDLLVAGSAPGPNNSDIAAAAYLPGGTPDTSFGTGGVTAADFSGGDDRGRGIAIQADGKLVVAGYTTPSSTILKGNLALARFLPPDTKIGSFTASPNPVTSGSNVTLTASNILDSNPTRITQVAFYLDTDANGILDSGDTLLGYATQTSPGVWTFTLTVNLAPGTYTLFAQAQDSAGLFSDPVALSLTVQ